MTATHVSNLTPAIHHSSEHTNSDTQEHVIVELEHPSAPRALIVNAYWPQSSTETSLMWIRDLTQNCKHHDIIIARDFNAPHSHWGYTHTTPHGHNLDMTMSDYHFRLLNDIIIAIRIGNGVERDTNPDLMWHRGHSEGERKNTFENLGSDHYALLTELRHPHSKPIPTGRQTLFTKFEKVREELEQHNSPIVGIGMSTKLIKDTIRKYTKTLILTDKNPQVGRHLLELWDKRHRLIQRWRKNNHNLKL